MRIYLDHAATSFPKRPGVVEAMDDYSRQNGAPYGRGVYREAGELQRRIDQGRRMAAGIFGTVSPDQVVFCFNGTDVLNTAILGLCRPGDHIITTELEHNSVLRPLRFLKDDRHVAVTMLPPGLDGRVDPADVKAALRPETRLVAVTHASNVTGTIQPLDEIAEFVSGHSAYFLVDAAQTAGHLPLKIGNGIDLIACSGHKGLGGPLGTGLLLLTPGMESELIPLRFGGTGTQSESDLQPDHAPERYESGNHNSPGLIGLTTALEQVSVQDFAAVRRQEMELTGRLIDGFQRISNLTLHSPAPLEYQLGVVSVSAAEFEPQILAAVLDQEFGIQTRAGLHCAPLTHHWLGTRETGGTVRFSIGHATTKADIDAAVAAMQAILGS